VKKSPFQTLLAPDKSVEVTPTLFGRVIDLVFLEQPWLGHRRLIDDRVAVGAIRLTEHYARSKGKALSRRNVVHD